MSDKTDAAKKDKNYLSWFSPTTDSTARGQALIRAAARVIHHDDPHVCGKDTMAYDFVPLHFKAALQSVWVSKTVVRALEWKMPGMWGCGVARSHHYDALVQKCVTALGAKQLMVMGAGYDTRAYRFADLLKEHGTRVFELDLAPIQELKKAGVAKQLGGELPDHVTYVATNFNEMQLPEDLAAAGFQTGLPTVTLWEGVTMYLTPEAVDVSLKVLHKNMPKGSVLLMDFICKECVAEPSKFWGMEGCIRASQGIDGAPLDSDIPANGTAEWFAKRGFELVKLYTPDEMEQLYLIRADGTSAGRVVNGYYAVELKVV